ncbi:MAG TPA: GNAT family N-acetyltransferase, partial [Roseivirga sp.]
AGISIEIKRMYVLENFRGQGVAGLILTELEKWAKELGYSQSVLETGKRQPEAISLYTKHGYEVTENYGQYQGVANSVCFKKHLR